MNSILNKKWMAWLVLILLLLNISALGTIFYFTYHKQHRFHPGMDEPRVRPGKELIKELGMDSSQVTVFCNIRHEFFKEIKPSLDQLREKRKLIINEIGKDNPDTLYLKSMADTLGQIQAELKKETMRHYFRIRKICNPEQQKKLSGFYSAMFMMDEPGHGPGAGQGMKYRHGWRHNSDTTVKQ